MKPQNMHATAVVLGDRGVVISGDSGSGKSTLALALVARFGGNGMFARLIADDQILLAARGGRVLCSAPPAISGLAEVRGVGPLEVSFERAAVVDLLVRLVPAGDAERFPEDSTAMLAGSPIPCLDLAERDVTGAVAAVAAKLRLPPFA
jgi:serine kinase of HPr protein (carbohydrate metabolism regulator)